MVLFDLGPHFPIFNQALFSEFKPNVGFTWATIRDQRTQSALYGRG